MRIGLIGSAHNPLQPGGPAQELVHLLPAGGEFRAYPSRVPAFPYTPVEQATQQLGHLDAAFAAVDDGCDAVVIDSLGDYGLAAIRASLSTPAIGAGETGMAAAAAIGPFAIVTVWPRSMNFIPEGLLRAYGYQADCTEIINVGLEDDVENLAGPDGYLARVRVGERGILHSIERAIELAQANGARSTLFGCTCMSPLAGRITAPPAMAIVNPLAAGVAAALAASPLGPRPAVRPGRRKLVARMVDAAMGEPAEDCPVCVVASAMEPSR